MGNLGRDPEMSYTQSGAAVCKFSIATTKNVKGENLTEWHNIVTWNKTAENVHKYLLKGAKVLIDGELKTSSWEGKDGNKKYKTEIIAYRVDFVDRKSSEGVSTSIKPKMDVTVTDSNFDMDIPF